MCQAIVGKYFTIIANTFFIRNWWRVCFASRARRRGRGVLCLDARPRIGLNIFSVFYFAAFGFFLIRSVLEVFSTLNRFRSCVCFDSLRGRCRIFLSAAPRKSCREQRTFVSSTSSRLRSKGRSKPIVSERASAGRL